MVQPNPHLQINIGQLLRRAGVAVDAQLIRHTIRALGGGGHQLQPVRHVVVAHHAAQRRGAGSMRDVTRCREL